MNEPPCSDSPVPRPTTYDSESSRSRLDAWGIRIVLSWHGRLARALVASGSVKSNAPDAASGAMVGGPAACLAGSCSQATLQQIASAEAAMPVLHLDPDQVVAGRDEARRALAWARERLKEGPILIASSATPDQVTAL